MSVQQHSAVCLILGSSVAKCARHFACIFVFFCMPVCEMCVLVRTNARTSFACPDTNWVALFYKLIYRYNTRRIFWVCVLRYHVLERVSCLCCVASVHDVAQLAQCAHVRLIKCDFEYSFRVCVCLCVYVPVSTINSPQTHSHTQTPNLDLHAYKNALKPSHCKSSSRHAMNQRVLRIIFSEIIALTTHHHTRINPKCVLLCVCVIVAVQKLQLKKCANASCKMRVYVR